MSTYENKITYLLGAGASAKVLPTVKATQSTRGIANSLREFSTQLTNNSNIDSKYNPFVENLAKDLNWVAENSDKFGTPDTYAKYLYLRERSKLDNLKSALSIYFTHEQIINKKFDDRALIFLTTVMFDGGFFPPNINILNWNYDFQIELAGQIFREENYSQIQSAISVHQPPLISYYPPIGARTINPNKKFQLVHLNGIAGSYHASQYKSTMNAFLNKPIDINDFLNRFWFDPDINHDLLTFAWETDTKASNHLDQRIEYAQAIASDTNILVVIGYSFPFFNREIDKKIFESLKSSGNLKKIFFQDPYKKGDFLRNQFSLSDEIEILHIEDVDNYYVPLEL